MSPRKRPAPPLTYRNNEFSGDMAAWAAANCRDNEEQMERLQKNLYLARCTALTQRQQQIMALYYDEEMTMAEIARLLGIHRSTVSRSLARGRDRLRCHLRYSF